MNRAIRYAAVVAAFAAAAVAFVQDAALAGVLATLSGILIAAAIVRSEKAEE